MYQMYQCHCSDFYYHQQSGWAGNYEWSHFAHMVGSLYYCLFCPWEESWPQGMLRAEKLRAAGLLCTVKNLTTIFE